MFDPSRRRMLHALIVSLLVHAVILIGVVTVLPVRVEVQSSTISAVLGADRGRQSATQEAVSPAAAPVVRPDDVARWNRPKSAVGAVFQQPSREASSEAPAESAVPPVLAPASAASAMQRLPVDGASADDLRQYRLALAIAARRFRQYPALARERGWEGTVALALSIRSHFSEPEIILVRSSGHAVLDRQAQEMMVRAARTTELPEGLKGQDLQIVLPVQFSLDGDQ